AWAPMRSLAVTCRGAALPEVPEQVRCPAAMRAMQSREPGRPASRQRPAGTHPLGLLVGEDARCPSSCEVAVNFEGVPGASLVRIHPVFTCKADRERIRQLLPVWFQKEPHAVSSAGKTQGQAHRPPVWPPFLGVHACTCLTG
uniref:Uncharacterized protein n=1 Tax=Canis lupus dingo TaxID=286419 RepID=A0A8C0LLF1_CANLU